MEKITTEQAYEMGTKGAPATEAERLLFEAWMRGHCWKLSCEWDGKQYTNLIERAGGICPHAIRTRQLWAAWRDRAALAQPDCRTCTRMQPEDEFSAQRCGEICTNCDKYEAAPRLVLWRTEP